MNREPSRWRSESIFCAVLGGLLAIYFHAILFGGRSLFLRDLYNFHWPLWSASATFFHQGGLPFWNPLTHFGQSMSGNPNYLVFYPPAWLRFVVDPLRAMNWFIVLHLWAGGIVFRRLLLRWGVTPGGALWGGLLYTFCGVSLSLCCVLNLVPYIFLAPAVLLCVERVLAGEGRTAVPALGLLGALAITVFEPVMMAGIVLLVLARVGAGLCHRGRIRNWRRPLVRLAAAGTLAVLLSLPAWLESARLLDQSIRSEQVQITQGLYNQHPALTIGIWIPNPFAVSFDRLESFRGGKYNAGQHPYLPTMFIGFTALLLAPGAFWGGRRKQAVLALGASAGFLLLAFGTNIPGIGDWPKHIPLLQWARYTQKYIYFVSAGMILLTILGLEAHGRGIRWSKPRRAATLLVPIILLGVSALVPGSSLGSLLTVSAASALLVAVVIGWPGAGGSLPVPSPLPAEPEGAGPVPAGLAPSGAPAPPSGSRPAWRIHLIGGCLLLELLAGNFFVVPNAERLSFLDPIPAVTAIRHREGRLDTFRVWVEGDPGFPAPVGSAVWRYHSYRRAGYPFAGFTEGVTYAFNPVIDGLETRAAAHFRRIFEKLPDNAKERLLERCGVRYLISHRRISLPGLRPVAAFTAGGNRAFTLYHLPNAAGRFALFQRFRVADESENAVRRLLEAPPDTVYLTPSAGRLTLPPPGPPGGTGQRIELLGASADEIRLLARCERTGVLVIRDTFYPGWTATVDGQPAPVHQADFFFRGIVVPPGEHRVTCRYSLRVEEILAGIFGLSPR